MAARILPALRESERLTPAEQARALRSLADRALDHASLRGVMRAFLTGGAGPGTTSGTTHSSCL
eukprot:COSAG01_NODE_1809_length_9182_cov_6.406914_4_plen_64_part_00